jgi:hypothetical protein
MPLSYREIDICHRTMSSNALFALVMDALDTHQDLSVVRAADGEKMLYTHCRKNTGILKPFGGLTDEWFMKYGCKDIPCDVLVSRIESAVSECDYFAPSISGLTMPGFDLYDLFPARNMYVDNFFPNLWNAEQKQALLEKSERIVIIHRGSESIYRFIGLHESKSLWILLSMWTQSEQVIKEANSFRPTLTLFSGGPASKYIGPRIPGVTLDIGQAMIRWIP